MLIHMALLIITGPPRTRMCDAAFLPRSPFRGWGRRALRRSPAVTLPLALMGPFLASAAEPTSAHAQEGRRISGDVFDLYSEEPLVNAVVRISGTDRWDLTDEQGRFEFRDLEPAEYVVEVEHLSYQPGGEAVELEEAADEVTLEIRLAPDGIPLAPVDVETTEPEPSRGARLESVYERKEHMERVGQGIFLDQEDLRIYGQGGRISAVVNGQIPGTTATRRERVIFRNAGGSCTPHWYLDGQRVNHEDARGVPTGDVELIEVYRGLSELPASFDYTRCGIIAIWTKRVEEEAEPFTWGRVLALTGFATIVYGLNQLFH